MLYTGFILSGIWLRSPGAIHQVAVRHVLDVIHGQATYDTLVVAGPVWHVAAEVQAELDWAETQADHLDQREGDQEALVVAFRVAASN